MALRNYLVLTSSFLLLSCSVNYGTAKYVIRLRSDAQCPMPGYFRDESDCRKFYRCAEHPTGVPGQNYITRAEFNCPPGTIFDEVLSSCNHIMFVQNIPPGCDTSGAVTGSQSAGSSSGVDSSSQPPMSDSSDSSSQVPSTVQPVPSTTMAPAPPSGIQIGQPPQLPLNPPENMQMLPMIPSDQSQQPMLPSINLPMNPPGGDHQPPMFPSINIPMMPGEQGQQPMFPSINFPSLPGSQGQQPMIPGIPSVPSGGQQQQSLLSSLLNFQMHDRDHRGQQSLIPTSLPSFNLPSISGSPKLPQFSFPSRLTLSGGHLPLYNNQHDAQNTSPEQNLQNLGGSSSGITQITAQNNEQPDNKPTGIAGWVTPQRFLQQAVVKPSQQGADGSTGGWVVPDNFPTFYSAFAGGSPVFLSAYASNPSSLIII